MNHISRLKQIKRSPAWRAYHSRIVMYVVMAFYFIGSVWCRPERAWMLCPAVIVTVCVHQFMGKNHREFCNYCDLCLYIFLLSSFAYGVQAYDKAHVEPIKDFGVFTGLEVIQPAGITLLGGIALALLVMHAFQKHYYKQLRRAYVFAGMSAIIVLAAGAASHVAWFGLAFSTSGVATFLCLFPKVASNMDGDGNDIAETRQAPPPVSQEAATGNQIKKKASRYIKPAIGLFLALSVMAGVKIWPIKDPFYALPTDFILIFLAVNSAFYLVFYAACDLWASRRKHN